MDEVKKGITEGEFFQEFTSQNFPGIKNKLDKLTLGIAGCGGLGSNAAVMLVRSGVKKIVIVDNDKVEISNLNRQNFYLEDVGTWKVDALSRLLRKINPFIEVEKFKEKLDNKNVFKIFGKCGIVLEAFDNIKGKSMLIKTFSKKKFNDKFLITASGLAGIGSANSIRTRQLSENIFVCGDLKSLPGEKNGLMAPRVIITAGHQANMVLRIISGLL